MNMVRGAEGAQIAQVLRNSVVGMPFGQRIRNLRTVLGWSQRKAAEHFEVSVRTVLRHGQGESFRPVVATGAEVARPGDR
jgi:ribosome-binding protein aMBF1 (putative translation factor)